MLSGPSAVSSSITPALESLSRLSRWRRPRKVLLREGAPIHLIEQLRSATEASAVAAASTASPSSLPPRLLSEKQVDLILKTLTSMADGGERAQVSEARGEGRKRERKRERD